MPERFHSANVVPYDLILRILLPIGRVEHERYGCDALPQGPCRKKACLFPPNASLQVRHHFCLSAPPPAPPRVRTQTPEPPQRPGRRLVRQMGPQGDGRACAAMQVSSERPGRRLLQLPHRWPRANPSSEAHRMEEKTEIRTMTEERLQSVRSANPAGRPLLADARRRLLDHRRLETPTERAAPSAIPWRHHLPLHFTGTLQPEEQSNIGKKLLDVGKWSLLVRPLHQELRLHRQSYYIAAGLLLMRQTIASAFQAPPAAAAVEEVVEVDCTAAPCCSVENVGAP